MLPVEPPHSGGSFKWHRGLGSKWKWGRWSAVGMYLAVLGNILLGLAVLLWTLQETDDLIDRLSAAMGYCGILLVSIGVASYVHVSSTSERPPQLHLHGMVLFLMLLSLQSHVAAEALFQFSSCTASTLVLMLDWIFFTGYKVFFFSLLKEKMKVLGRPTGFLVNAPLWGRTFAASIVLASLAVLSACCFQVGLQLNDVSCSEAKRVFTPDVVATDVSWGIKVFAILFLFVGTASSMIMLIAACFMINTVRGLRKRVMLKLSELEVPADEVAKVRSTLGFHSWGAYLSLMTTILVFFLSNFVDGFDLFGERSENLVGGVGVLLDTVGDLVGILLLSGIGLLLLREDGQAGDISGHIHGLLHSAISTSRADVVFEGLVASTRSGVCVASFPGKYLSDWKALTWACEQGDLSSACVFLPSNDPKGRFRQHMERPETPGKCWCHQLYGSEMNWGCMWFHEWKTNIEQAVDLGLELLVVFFPGEVGQGVIEWGKLQDCNKLYDGVGLGGSQKGEVAYLQMRGFVVTYEDLQTFRKRGWGFRAARKYGAAES